MSPTPHSAPEASPVSASWQRSFSEHKVDRASSQKPNVLTLQELRQAREPVDELISVARQENDRLHSIVGKVGYVLLLTSADGVVVDVRGDPARAAEFTHWGIWQGGVWSESVEGTNGIGTCIAEQRPVTVHRTQHFRTRHGSLSCCGAPVFDPQGKLAAVLDVSSADPEIADRSHALALALTVNSARAIEENLFRARFPRAWLLAAASASDPGQSLLLAVDDYQRILAADRRARSILGLDDAGLAAGASLWTFFDGSPSAFLARDPTTVRMHRAGGEWRGLLMPPQGRQGLAGAAATQPAGGTLSPRERAILELIGRGHSNKQIARLLRISPETVKSHVKNVFVKLRVERRAQAIYQAKTLGVVPAP